MAGKQAAETSVRAGTTGWPVSTLLLRKLKGTKAGAHPCDGAGQLLKAWSDN